MAKNSYIEKALHIESWESMQQRGTLGNAEPLKNNKQKKVCQTSMPAGQADLIGLSPEARVLGLNCILRIDYQFAERLQWTNLSARQQETAKQELINKQLIKEVFLGKSLFIAPLEKLFLLFGMESPYKRNTWETHSFLVLLAAKLIAANPLVKHVEREVSIGDSNSTIDVVSVAKNGQRWAWEITNYCKTNVSANASKLQGKGFSQIIFLCSDYNIKQGVWANKDWRYISLEELDKLLDACPNIGWKMLIALCRLAGLRRGEALELTWSDINWQEHYFTVIALKTGRRRIVPIVPNLYQLLLEAFDQAQENEERICPISHYCLWRNFQVYRKRAGLEKWKDAFKVMRRNCETDWAQKYPQYVVSTWIGHNIQVSARHYLQVPAELYKMVAGTNLAPTGTKTGTKSKTEPSEIK